MSYSIVSENYYLINGIDSTMHSLKRHTPGRNFSMAFVHMESCRRVMDDFDANEYDLIVFLTEHENDYRLFPATGKSCYTTHIVSSAPYNEFYKFLRYTLKYFSALRGFPRQVYDVTTFTDTENAIIKLMTVNQTSKSIASILSMDVKGYYQRRRKLMDKLNAKGFVKTYAKLQQLECYNHFFVLPE